MPVVGHAIVGIAAAVTTARAAPRSTTTGLGPWALALVFLSYLPDITAQLPGLSGWRDAALFSHSILFGVVCGVAFAPLLSRFVGARRRTASAIAVFAVLTHDVLDILQSPGRMPAWPLSTWRMPDAIVVIPTGLWGETLVLSPLLLFACLWHVLPNDRSALAPARYRWVPWCVIGAVVASAGLVNYLRDVRHDDILRARDLVAQREYVRALEACDRADRWPSTAAPGRVDYVRAEAWLGLGNRAEAERYYLASRRRDPAYFWTVADLAVLYASAGKPVEQRRRDVAPWLAVLESEFAGHPALPRTLERVHRRLQDGS